MRINADRNTTSILKPDEAAKELMETPARDARAATETSSFLWDDVRLSAASVQSPLPTTAQSIADRMASKRDPQAALLSR